MRTPKTAIWICVAGAVGVLVALGVLNSRHATPRLAKHLLPVADNVPRPKEADRLYVSNPKVAAEKYKEFVAKHAAAKDPVIQDQVGTARLKIGYIAAHDKNWVLARQSFLAADKQTKGTESTGDFGTVNEQGAYEAIVCLEADGKQDEARVRYTEFIKQRPLSPLCMACYRRLTRLNGDKSTPELEHLIETATRKQDANAKFESSVCGPKTIAYLFDSGALNAGNQPHDYKTVAKLCHTTDSGTTITGMLDGFKAFGIKAAGYKVNRQDLVRVKSPAVLLWGTHYIALLKVDSRSILAYDSFTRSERNFSIPALDDPDFFVNVITLNAQPLK